MSILNYFQETKGELKHVNWPTKNQAVNYTIIVIAFSLGISLFLAFFDLLFGTVIGKLIT